MHGSFSLFAIILFIACFMTEIEGISFNDAIYFSVVVSFILLFLYIILIIFNF